MDSQAGRPAVSLPPRITTAQERQTGSRPVTRERIEELEEQVAYLTSELGLMLDEHRIATLRKSLAVSPSCARMLEALYQAKGRPLGHVRLQEAMRSNDESGKGVAVRIHEARKAMGRDAIVTAGHQGYSLSDTGAERIRALAA